MQQTESIFLLDFDGVLCNSLNESLIVSYNTYHKCNLRSIKNISSKECEYFYNNRWLVRPAGEYFILWKGYELGININQLMFNKLKTKYHESISSFHKSFYNQREELKKNISYWLSLHKTYDNVKNFLVNTQDKIFIVTNKDERSVVSISKHFGYFDKIKDIYSMEISFNKKVLVKKIFNDYKVNLKEQSIFFIDDNIENLIEIDSMPEHINAILATWGYVGNIDRINFKKITNMDTFI